MMELSAEQTNAVMLSRATKRMAIIAGAGSGKTRTLAAIAEVSNEQDSVRPLALMLTNAAAAEFRERGFFADVSTFHAFAYRIVCENHAQLGYSSAPWIISEEEADLRIKEVRDDLRCKASMATIRRAHESRGPIDERGVWATVVEYRNRLKSSNCIDFETVVRDAIRALDFVGMDLRAQYGTVIIDEAQDADRRLWAFIDKLNPDRIVAAGDPRQAIFGFRGGDCSAFMRFAEANKCLELTMNYRSNNYIVAFANVLAKRISPKLAPMVAYDNIADKLTALGFRSVDAHKEKVVIGDSLDSVLRNVVPSFIQKGMRVAILAAWNKTLDALESDLYQRAGGRINEWHRNVTTEAERLAREVVQSTLRLKFDSEDRVTMAILKSVCGGIHPRDDPRFAEEFARLAEWGDDYPAYLASSVLGDSTARKQSADKPMLTLSTIHSMKSQESDVVIVLSDGFTDTISSLKLQYVAATRAKEALYITTLH